MRRHVSLVACLFALWGCSNKIKDQGVLVKVNNPSNLGGIVQLRVDLSNASTSETLLLPPARRAVLINFPTAFSVNLPSNRAGEVDMALDGLDSSGAVVASGSASAVLQASAFVTVSADLHSPAPLCTNGAGVTGRSCTDASIPSDLGPPADSGGVRTDAGVKPDLLIVGADVPTGPDLTTGSAEVSTPMNSDTGTGTDIPVSTDAKLSGIDTQETPTTGGRSTGSGGATFAGNGGYWGTGGVAGGGTPGAGGITGLAGTTGSGGITSVATGGVVTTGGLTSAGGVMSSGGVIEPAGRDGSADAAGRDVSADAGKNGDSGQVGIGDALQVPPDARATQWVVNLANPGDQGISHVAADQVGNFYIAGVYNTAFQLGSTALPASAQGDAFLAKTTATGTILWVQPLAGPGTVTVKDLLVDGAGYPVVLGAYATDGTSQGHMTIGTSTLTLTSANIGTGWLFVARFAPDGTAVWADSLFDSDYPITDDYFLNPSRMTTGLNGDTEVAVASTGQLELRTGADQSTVYSLKPLSDTSAPFLYTSYLYLVDISSAGSLVGYYSIGCGDTSEATVAGIATPIGTNASTTYFAGQCSTPDLPTTNSQNAPANPRGFAPVSDASGGFLLKLNQNAPGSFAADNTAAISVSAVLADPTGDLYDVRTGNVISLERRNATSLSPTWLTSGTKATGTSTGVKLVLDGRGNVVVAGPCTGFVSLDPKSASGDITCQGAILAAFESGRGSFVWAHTYPIELTNVFREQDSFDAVAASDDGVFFGASAKQSIDSLGQKVTADGDDISFGVLVP